MIFSTNIAVRFNHVDAAGIVFYPRYFEMLNEVVEQWFEEALGINFRELISQNRGIPTVKCDTEFLHPSRLSERLRFELQVYKLGRSKFDLYIRCSCNTEARLTARMSLVHCQLSPLAAQSLPDEMRQAMRAYLISNT